MTSTDLYAELRINPADASLRLVLSDMLLEEGFTDQAAIAGLRNEKRPKIPLADLDKQAAQLLAGCAFLPASFPKRFARNVADLKTMTPLQYRLLWHFVYSYRRQIRSNSPAAIMAAKLFAILGPKWQRKTSTSGKMSRIAPAFEGREDLVE